MFYPALTALPSTFSIPLSALVVIISDTFSFHCVSNSVILDLLHSLLDIICTLTFYIA